RAVHITEIIGRQQGVYEVVRFSVFDQAALPVNGDEIERVGARGQLEHLQIANGRKGLQDQRPGQLVHERQIHSRQGLDQNSVLAELRVVQSDARGMQEFGTIKASGKLV